VRSAELGSVRLVTFNTLYVLGATIGFPVIILSKGPGFDPYSYEIAIVTALTVVGAAIMFGVSEGRSVLPNFLAVLCATLLIYAGLLVVISGNVPAAVASYVLHFKFVLLGIAFYWALNTWLERLLPLALLCLALPIIYYGLYQYFVLRGVSLSALIGIEGFRRLSSVFPNPNMYGVYLTSILLFALAFAEFPSRIKSTVWIAAWLYLPLFLSILLTFSRRAWVMVAVSLSFLAFLRGVRLVYVLLPILLMGVYYASDFGSLLLRVQTIFDPTYVSNRVRIDEIATIINHLSSDGLAVLFGGGTGRYGPAAELVAGGQFELVHNYLALLLLEYGLFGVGLYLTLVGTVVAYGWRAAGAYRRGSSEWYRTILYTLNFALLQTAGIFGLTPITFPLDFMGWALMGLVLFHYRRSGAAQGTSRGPQLHSAGASRAEALGTA
jgi:hypothetical protein